MNREQQIIDSIKGKIKSVLDDKGKIVFSNFEEYGDDYGYWSLTESKKCPYTTFDHLQGGEMVSGYITSLKKVDNDYYAFVVNDNTIDWYNFVYIDSLLDLVDIKECIDAL